MNQEYKKNKNKALKSEPEMINGFQIYLFIFIYICCYMFCIYVYEMNVLKTHITFYWIKRARASILIFISTI